MITRPVSILGPGANLLVDQRQQHVPPGQRPVDGARHGDDQRPRVHQRRQGARSRTPPPSSSTTTARSSSTATSFMPTAGPSGSSVIFSNAAAMLTMRDSTMRDNAVEHVVLIRQHAVRDRRTRRSRATPAQARRFSSSSGTPGGIITGATSHEQRPGLWHANTVRTSSVTIRNSIFSQNSVNVRRTGGATCASQRHSVGRLQPDRQRWRRLVVHDRAERPHRPVVQPAAVGARLLRRDHEDPGCPRPRALSSTRAGASA